MLKKLIFIGCTILIASCGYFEKITYYEPEQRSNVFVSKGARGPIEKTKFSINQDIDMHLIIFHNSNAPYIRCWWTLPKKSEMRFLGSEIILKTSDSTIANKIPIGKIQANYINNGIGSLKYFEAKDLLIGETYLLKSAFGKEVRSNRPFEIKAPIKNDLPIKFDLKLPPFALNGEKRELPMVSYTKKEGAFYQIVQVQ